MRRLFNARFRRSALVFIAISLSSCVTLMAPYDEKIDEMTTSLQRKISTELESLSAAQSPDCLYPNHAAFYCDVRVDLSALEVRAEAHQLNDLTIGQIRELRGAIDDLDKLHQRASSKPRCMQASEFPDLQRGINQITTAIVKLELAKKRGQP